MLEHWNNGHCKIVGMISWPNEHSIIPCDWPKENAINNFLTKFCIEFPRRLVKDLFQFRAEGFGRKGFYDIVADACLNRLYDIFLLSFRSHHEKRNIL